MVVRAVLVALLAAFCVTSLPTATFARSPQLTYQQKREAKKLFDDAHRAYLNGDYEQAIAGWEKAYEISLRPLIFESISHAYERLGELQKAHEYLSKWRQAAPATEVPALDKKLAKLKQRIAEKEAEEKEHQAREEQLRKERDEAERRRLAAEKQQAEQEEQGAPVLPLTLMGTGGGLVIAGVIMDIIAATSRPDQDAVCTEHSGQLLCREESRDDIETSNALAIAGDVTWIVGGLVAATGLVLLLTTGSDAPGQDASDAVGEEPDVKATLVPCFGPGQGGLSIHGQF